MAIELRRDPQTIRATRELAQNLWKLTQILRALSWYNITKKKKQQHFFRLSSGRRWPQKMPSCHLGSWGNLTVTTSGNCIWTTSPISPGAAFPHPHMGLLAHTRTFEPNWRLSDKISCAARRSSDATKRHMSPLGKLTRIWSSSISITSPTWPSTWPYRGDRILSRTLTRSPTTKLPTWWSRWVD